MNLEKQKYLIILILLSINLLLITTNIIFEKYWYAFILFLCIPSILYSVSSILIILNKLCRKDTDYDINRNNIGKNYLYIMPCYNENELELKKTLDSLVNQKVCKKDKRAIIIICDGRVTGEGNNNSTDKILLNILENKNNPINYNYNTRESDINTINLYVGKYNEINYILIIKDRNYGKRDSLVLIRRLCYYYNNISEINNKYITDIFIKSMNLIFNNYHHKNKIDYIINIDADTIFDFNCTYELIKGIEQNINNVGCVGYVDINMTNSFIFNPYNLYQYAEYMFSQCLKRNAQSNITHKVNCLSGCVQILKVCEENCGELILEKFNYCPKETDNIFTHIRGIASEDRNHVCIMHSMYPNVRTVQNLNAICYTNIPKSPRVFLSQRRRWTLGAISNDLLLLFSPNINIFERIASFINIVTLILMPFIFIATILFIKNLIINPSYLMLYLSIIMLIPLSFGFFIPIFIKRMYFKDAIYFYLSYLFFLTFGFIITLSIYTYSLLGMDTITWGKTRSIMKNAIKSNDANIKSNKTNVNYLEYDDFIDYKNTLEPINSRESYV
jgi:chitin synthase